MLRNGHEEQSFSKKVTSSCCGLKSIDTDQIMREGVRREQQDSRLPTNHFVRSFATWNPFFRTGGNYFQNCMMENPRHPISELYVGKLTHLVDLQCWKVSFKTEV